jgi:hypothetical protein
MRRWLKTGVSLLAVLSLGFLGFSWLFPPPQKVIRKQLLAMARLASFERERSTLSETGELAKARFLFR